MDEKVRESLLALVRQIDDSLQAIRVILNASGHSGPMSVSPRDHKRGGAYIHSRIHTAESLPADQLGPQPDYRDEHWPAAVEEHLVVNDKSDIEKQFRAVQIINLIGVPADDKRILDCGCGEGHVAREAAYRARSVVGYDIRLAPSWDSLRCDNLAFTTDKKEVEGRGPYDLIILYDVLDHLEHDDPITFMTWVTSLLSPGGQIFMRTHPWTARHGGHLYEQGLNKAYLHLALTADELARAGFKLLPNLRLNRPISAYEHIVGEAGLKIMERSCRVASVEPFFDGALMDRIMKVTWRGAIDHDRASKIMTNQFIDFYLTRR